MYMDFIPLSMVASDLSRILYGSSGKGICYLLLPCGSCKQDVSEPLLAIICKEPHGEHDAFYERRQQTELSTCAV
jgi:hypothetical protein